MVGFRMPQLQRRAEPASCAPQEAVVQNAVYQPMGNAAMQDQLNACGPDSPPELIDIGGKMSTGVASRGSGR
ncbi:MAG: hypothetical protein R3F61_21050 [Myxococcota bacterium]